MEPGNASSDVNVLDVLSPALKYEAMLKECGGPGPTDDKMILVFKVLDQIIPHTGVFTKLMQMCRDEIFEAVYSDQFTSEKEKTHKYIQRIPYFTLVKRVYSERDENIISLEEQLAKVQERLSDKQKQYTEAVSYTEELEEEVSALKATISDLEKQITAHQQEISSLEKRLQSEIDSRIKMQQQLEDEIAGLKEELEEMHRDISFLKQFKNGYDRLQQGFNRFTSLEEIPLQQKKKNKPIANKHTHILSDIENSLKIEKQLLMVQNGNIEEFDKFMEQYEADIKALLESESEVTKEKKYDLERAEQQRPLSPTSELQLTQERFKKAITDTTTELKLLRQHKNGLLEQLQSLEEGKPSVKNRKKHRKGNSLKRSESGGSEDIDGVFDEESSKDPFVINERVFSKYAAMMYTSDNNGKTYHEFKGAKFCESCGEKTVLCPHKILQEEHVFPLSSSVTHIKITRPKARINAEQLIGLLPKQVVEQNILKEETTPVQQHTTEEPLTESQELQFTHSVQRLWEDYERRVDLKRTVPRSLPMNQVISKVEHFAAYILCKDDTHHEDDEVTDILDSLYAFMADRYQETEASYLVVHDFISALIQYSSENKLIWLVTHALAGNLDGAVIRYILVMTDFIKKIDWMTVNDFKNFATVIYPSLTEDDLEQIQMGYVSFSENKISESLVAEYIVYMIVKGREPRFLEMEATLLASHCNGDYMTEEEFTEASDQILGVPDLKLRRHLYRQSEKYILYKDGISGGVPIRRLSQILSYLHLLNLSPVMMQHVYDAVMEGRAADAQSDAGLRMNHKVASHFKVKGLSDIKKLLKYKCV